MSKWIRKCQNFASNDQNASVSDANQTWLYETPVPFYCICSVKCIFTCWKKTHTSSCGFTCNWCGILMVRKYCSILFFRFFFQAVLIKKKYRQWKTITDFSQCSKGQVINTWIFYDSSPSFKKYQCQCCNKACLTWKKEKKWIDIKKNLK